LLRPAGCVKKKTLNNTAQVLTGQGGERSRFAHNGLGGYLYEIVPGFCANCATILVINGFCGQKDERILKDYDEVAGAGSRLGG